MNFLRDVGVAVTWRKLAIMLALGAAMPVAAAMVGVQTARLAVFIAIGFSAVGNLLVALVADEVARRGVALRLVYPLAMVSVLLINCAIAEVAHWTQWYAGEAFNPQPLPAALRWTAVLRFGLDQSLWGVFALFVYLNRRIAERMLQGIRETQLRRVRLERQLVESRLAAAQAQVDPQMLFGALAEVRGKLSAGAPEANEQLDLLIHQLRAALARTVVVGESGTDRS